MSILDQRPDAFEERNLFYWAVLGLVSATGALDGLLDRHGRGDGAPPDLGDPDLLAVLGAVSLSQRIRAALPPAGPARAPDADDADADAPLPRELLR